MEEKCPTRNPSPLCSVIIPAYNASRFIEDTVKSVIAQTFPDWECIVVDDCSTDNTFELVSAIAENEPRLRVIQNSENMRVAKTRMAGVAAARGKYVAFLDGDDMFVPEKLERQISLLEYCSEICQSSVPAPSVPSSTSRFKANCPSLNSGSPSKAALRAMPRFTDDTPRRPVKSSCSI